MKCLDCDGDVDLVERQVRCKVRGKDGGFILCSVLSRATEPGIVGVCKKCGLETILVEITFENNILDLSLGGKELWEP